jgi:CDP-6-deoxy-D-xylo-4-hexulose-3-dehydrase
MNQAITIDGERLQKDRLRAQILELVDAYAALQYAPRAFRPGQDAVPPSGKVLGAPELRNMVEASLDGWLTTGRFNTLFEARLAEYLGVKHVSTVNSGSSANLVAF